VLDDVELSLLVPETEVTDDAVEGISLVVSSWGGLDEVASRATRQAMETGGGTQPLCSAVQRLHTAAASQRRSGPQLAQWSGSGCKQPAPSMGSEAATRTGAHAAEELHRACIGGGGTRAV